MCPAVPANAGLYAERVGALNFVLRDAEAAKRVLSQLKRIARSANLSMSDLVFISSNL